MNQFMVYDNDGSAVFKLMLTSEDYDLARRQKITLFRVCGEGVTYIYDADPDPDRGCWRTVENNPTQDGLYLVQTDAGRPFDHKVVAVWELGHWRTPSVGRIDGDNRISGIVKWKGPLKCD